MLGSLTLMGSRAHRNLSHKAMSLQRLSSEMPISVFGAKNKIKKKEKEKPKKTKSGGFKGSSQHPWAQDDKNLLF